MWKNKNIATATFGAKSLNLTIPHDCERNFSPMILEGSQMGELYHCRIQQMVFIWVYFKSLNILFLSRPEYRYCLNRERQDKTRIENPKVKGLKNPQEVGKRWMESEN